jgi:molybdate transport repressor ModE-like protein
MKRIDRLTLRQLKALHAIVAEGKITAAAEALRLTPPAVHSQLKTLEATIGCPLVARTGGDGFRPTSEGEALLAAHAEMHAALERAIHQIEALRKGQAGSVVLGVVSTAKYFAPGIVALLRRELPDLEVVLRIGNRQRMLAALAGRELDLCIMGRPPREPRVDSAVLGPHPHVLIASPAHRLAGRGPVSAEDILGEHFVMREPGSGTRILASRYLDEIGAGQEIDATEMESNETIKQAVMSGLGIALISGHTVVEELRTRRLALLDSVGLPIVRQWFVVRREDAAPTMAARSVWNWIMERRADLLPDFDAAVRSQDGKGEPASL